jgi:hypothetical protein
MIECRAVAAQLEAASGQESQPAAAERIAYGVLVASLEEGFVTTLQHAMDVLRRFGTPAGALGEQWLSEQESSGGGSPDGPADLARRSWAATPSPSVFPVWT